MLTNTAMDRDCASRAGHAVAGARRRFSVSVCRGRLLVAVAAILIFAGVSLSAEAARRRTPSRSMTMVATAYCLRGTTASGAVVHRGTVAADALHSP